MNGMADKTQPSGGSPQIAKGNGEAPVQAYIAAMPGWKRDAGRESRRWRMSRWSIR